ncbi:MAG: hypothetical protein ACREBI_10865 [Nitrosotalea sp.]
MANKKKTPEPTSQPKPKRNISIRPHLLSWAVFIPTVAVVFISLIATVFPALITRTTSPFQDQIFAPNIINPFQPGVMATPFILVNLLVLVAGIAYYKRSKGAEQLKKIANFELTKKQTLIGVIIILAIFCSIAAQTLGEAETWADYGPVKQRVQSWDISQFGKSFEPHFRYLLLSLSQHAFGNMRVIPFVISVILLVQVYFFTSDITGKRFPGIVAMALVLQSYVFIGFSTAATYDNTWILMYVFSLYLVLKFWPPSPVPYFLSFFSKPLTLAFLPMTLYFIARSTLPKKTRLYSLATYGVIIVMIAAAAVAYQTTFTGSAIAFDGPEFWQGFTAAAMQMRFDYIVMLFLLPLTVLLFFASRRGVLHADSILIFIFFVLIAAPLLTGLTQQTNEPYRWVSLSVFFAIGVGVLLSSRTRKPVELSSNM